MNPTIDWKQLPAIPDPEGFAGAYAGVSGGALLFAGGSNFPGKRAWEGGSKSWHDAVYALSSSDSRWSVIGKLPHPLANGVSVTYHDQLICAGGGNQGRHYAEVFTLSWDGRTLRRRSLAPLPEPCAFCAGAIVGDTLYVAAGLERPDAGGGTRNFWSLSLDKPDASWRREDPIPGVGRIYPVAGASKDTFYLFSGVAIRPNGTDRPDRTFLTDAYAYGPGGAGWRRIADLTRAVAAAPSPVPVTSDGELLLLSGDDGTRTKLDGPNHPGFSRDGFLFDPASARWSPIGEGPISRTAVPTTVWHGRWVMAGGERMPGYRSNQVWSLEFNPGP